jgi:TPR repeat protein
VTKDESKAVHWYEAAAAQGDADAQFNLGMSGSFEMTT